MHMARPWAAYLVALFNHVACEPARTSKPPAPTRTPPLSLILFLATPLPRLLFRNQLQRTNGRGSRRPRPPAPPTTPPPPHRPPTRNVTWFTGAMCGGCRSPTSDLKLGQVQARGVAARCRARHAAGWTKP